MRWFSSPGTNYKYYNYYKIMSNRVYLNISFKWIYIYLWDRALVGWNSLTSLPVSIRIRTHDPQSQCTSVDAAATAAWCTTGLLRGRGIRCAFSSVQWLFPPVGEFYICFSYFICIQFSRSMNLRADLPTFHFKKIKRNIAGNS